jgi:hypothetical protein
MPLQIINGLTLIPQYVYGAGRDFTQQEVQFAAKCLSLEPVSRTDALQHIRASLMSFDAGHGENAYLSGRRKPRHPTRSHYLYLVP